MSTISPSDILESFIEDEAAAYLRGDQGSFFPHNHHRIIPLISKAPKLLTEHRRIDFYFHLLRLDVCPALKSEDEFKLLLDAYTSVKPLLARGYPACLLGRAKGLFLFGSDDYGPLAGESGITQESYVKLLKFWRYAGSFWHMSGMLKKRPKFLELSDDNVLLNRVVQVILRIRPADDVPRSTSLWFWALMLLAIQQQESGITVTEWLMQADWPVSEKPKVLLYLTHYLRASSREDILLKFNSELETLFHEDES